jgi:hypothetical protein
MVIVGGFAPTAWAGDRGQDAAKGVLLGIGTGLVLGALLGGAAAAAPPAPPVIYTPPPVVHAPPPPVVYVPPPVVFVLPPPRGVHVPAPTVVYGPAVGMYGRDGHRSPHHKHKDKWGKHARGHGHRPDADIPWGHLPPPEYRRGYLNVPPGHLPPPEYR